MRYMSVAQAAISWRISEPRVRQWLAAGRIKGATKLGRDWLIPARAARPTPKRPYGLIA